MFHHPAWAVGSYNSSPPAAGMVGTKSTGGFYHSSLSPCTSDDVECGGPPVGVDEDPAEREGHHVADHRAEEAPRDEAVESAISYWKFNHDLILQIFAYQYVLGMR